MSAAARNAAQPCERPNDQPANAGAANTAASTTATSNGHAHYGTEPRQFRHAWFGLCDPPPPPDSPWLDSALHALWLDNRTALLARLQAEFFNSLLPFEHSDWWRSSSTPPQWQQWYQQTDAFWQCYHNVQQGAARQVRWQPPTELRPELADEAPRLWYHWACMINQGTVYPSADKLAALLRSWLGDMPYLDRFELDVQLNPGIADGAHINQQCLTDSWLYACRVLQQRQWLPLRVMWQSHGTFSATDSQALLIYGQEAADCLLCYDPHSGHSGRLYSAPVSVEPQADASQHQGPQHSVWLELAQHTRRVHCMYPLAAPCAEIRPTLWRWLRHHLGLRRPKTTR